MRYIRERALRNAVGQEVRIDYGENKKLLGTFGLDEQGFFVETGEKVRIVGGELIYIWYQHSSGYLVPYKIKLTGLNPKKLLSYTRKPRMKRMGVEERVKTINAALEEGVDSLEEICRRSRLMPFGLNKFCREKGIVLPENLKPYRYRQGIDEAIEQGLTLREIGEKDGITRQAAEQYIIFSGQHRYWLERRKEVKKSGN